MHAPDLSVRVHSGSPDALLHAMVEVAKEGTGFPKLLNDDEIAFTVGGNINLAAALEMALNDGTVVMTVSPASYMSMPIAAKDIASYEDVFENLMATWDYPVRHYFTRQSSLEITNSHCHAIPFFTILNDSCVKAGKRSQPHRA